MSFGRYLLGLAGLAAVVGPVVFAAVVVRRRWLPGWSGSPARVAEAVVALALLIAAAELVGVLGLFRPGFLAATTVAIGLAAWRFGMPTGVQVERPRTQAPDPLALVLAAVTTAAVVGAWTARVAGIQRGGMSRSDTLSYHAPMAARFVQEHSLVHPFYATNEQVYTFFPANSELLHAIGMLLMGRDVLSPLLNLGWMVLALVAAFAIGRPFGRSPATLTAAAVTLATPVLVGYEPGEAFNDVVMLALFLAVAALLVNGREPAAIVIAGLAAGLAVGTKVTALLPVAALTVVLVVSLLEPARRVRVGALWLAALVATGGLWYLRNLFAFGSPLPAVRIGIGPVALASIDIRPMRTVADYATDWGVWETWFLPGLGDALGPVWWALLGLAALGLAASLVKPAVPALRAVGVLAISAAVVYPFTPATADGPPGHPYIFGGTLRHLTPALAVGLVALPLAGALTGRLRQRLFVVALASLAFITLDDSRSLVDHHPTEAAVAAALVLGCLALAWAVRSLPREAAVAGSAALVVLAGGLGWVAVSPFMRDRYVGQSPWARMLHGVRIAVVGSVPPYPLYGRDLSNHVQYLARKGAHGAFLPIRSCREWRHALNEGRYRYVAIGTRVNLVLAAHGEPTGNDREISWTAADPATTPVATSEGSRVFRIHGRLDPSGCAPATASERRRLRTMAGCLGEQGLEPTARRESLGALTLVTERPDGSRAVISLYRSKGQARYELARARGLVAALGGVARLRGPAVIAFLYAPTGRDLRAADRCVPLERGRQ